MVFAKALDPTRKTLVITEGLINYFDLATISIFWRNLANALKQFPQGAYVTDLYPNFAWHPVTKWINTFVQGLSIATKSHVSLHFNSHAANDFSMSNVAILRKIRTNASCEISIAASLLPVQ